MSGDETRVDDQDLVEGVFKHLLAVREPALPSTVDHAVRGGRRTLRRRRSAAGAAVISLAAVTALATGALLEQHPRIAVPSGSTPSSITTPSASPRASAAPSAQPSPTASAVQVSSTSGPVPSGATDTGASVMGSPTPTQH